MSEGTIIRRGKRSWRLKFDIGRDRITGKRQTRYVTVRGTKREAQDELTRLLNARNEGTYVEPHKRTVENFLQSWLDTTAPAKTAPKTLERYGEIITKHLIPGLGQILLQKLTATDIEGFYSDCLAFGRCDGKGGLAPRTVLHFHRVLSQAIKSAIKKKLLRHNPMEGVENAPKPEDREIQILSQSELSALLKAVRGKVLYMPVMLAASTGMRRGEVLGLRWRDVSFEQQTLAVQQTLEQTKAGLRFKPPKTPRSRRKIALPACCVEDLRTHKREQSEQRLALGLGKDENDLVFTTWDGQPRSPRAFTKEFSRAITTAKLPPVTFHGLRHSHITDLLARGVHVKVVSERAGHANIAVTLAIYGHVLPGMQEEAAALVDASLRAALEE